jgi:CIC family chloride channel protein
LLRGASDLRFSSAWELIPYAILGPLCGLVSIFFSCCMRWVHHGLIPRLPGPRWVMPAVGGLATGALAMAVPQVMDARYDFINNAMQFQPGAPGLENAGWWHLVLLFAMVVLARCVATAFTVGAGASGGVLGPSVFIGGATGALLGALGMAMAPEGFDDSLRQAMIPVGMAGVLAATMRTPLAAMVMVTEMTGSYGLVVPLMLVCVSAYVTGRRWGLNHEQVRSASESPAHTGDVMVHLLESISVSSVMDQRWSETATPDETLGALVRRMRPGTRPVFAVTEGDRLLGLVSTADIHRIMNEPALADVVIAADLMRAPSETVTPEEDLYQALNVLSRAGEDVLVVVSRDPSRRWLGMLTREGVFKTVRTHIADLQTMMLREHTGLSAIGREGALQQIVMGVAPARQNLVQRLLVPLQAVGLSLREADFRRQFGAQVIAIEESDGTILCPPPLDTPLRTGQRLLAIVSQDSATTGTDDGDT